MATKVIFIDRDGTIIVEPPITEQVNTLEEMQFLPHAISALRSIAGLDYELVIATNQDGLGTEVYPQESFDTVQGKMLEVLEGEDVRFDDILIDKSFPHEGLATRKPGVGMFGKYLNSPEYDLTGSFVIGDRLTDIILAKNLRNNMTEQERKLWYVFLRNCDVRFQRQKAIGNYIVDFYCAKAGLVIELDGGGHYTPEQAEKDNLRTKDLESIKLTVIRICNLDIDRNFRGVCEYIDLTVKNLSLSQLR